MRDARLHVGAVRFITEISSHMRDARLHVGPVRYHRM